VIVQANKVCLHATSQKRKIFILFANLCLAKLMSVFSV